MFYDTDVRDGPRAGLRPLLFPGKVDQRRAVTKPTGMRQTMDIDFTPFLNAGIPGIMLLWFMFRLERLLNRFDRTVQLVARAVIRLLEREHSNMASTLSKSISHTDRED